MNRVFRVYRSEGQSIHCHSDALHQNKCITVIQTLRIVVGNTGPVLQANRIDLLSERLCE